MKKVFYILIVLMISILASGCGELTPQGDRVNISIIVAPSTAGTVLTSGGDEIGNTATFTAIPNRNWQFAGWTSEIESFENPLEIELEDDINLIANFSLFSNDYNFELSVSDENSTIDLEFGQIPGATDVYDTDIDLEAPPPPPGNTLYAWFEGDGRNLIKDYRNAFTDQITWKLELQPGEADSIRFDWTSIEESFSGSLQLTDPNGSFSVNMFEETSLSIGSSEFESLQIIYSFDE